MTIKADSGLGVSPPGIKMPSPELPLCIPILHRLFRQQVSSFSLEYDTSCGIINPVRYSLERNQAIQDNKCVCVFMSTCVNNAANRVIYFP